MKHNTPTVTFRAWAVKHGTPWEITFPRKGQLGRQRRFFRSESLANESLAAWRDGEVSQALPKQQLEMILECVAQLPVGVRLNDVVAFYNAHHKDIARYTVAQACEAYLENLRVTCRADSYQREQERVSRIAVKGLGAKTLLAALSKPKWVQFIKAGSTYQTRYSRRRFISAVLGYAVSEGTLQTHPLAGWKFERAPKGKRPHFLQLGDVEALLEFTRYRRPDCLAAFVFQLFAGIRTEELCSAVTAFKRPLEWGDVKLGRLIDVGGEVSKTGDRRVIRFWPEAMTKWLAICPERTGPISPKCYLSDVKTKLVRQLNESRVSRGLDPVPFRQNDFRRTFATHCVQKIGPEKAQEILGHPEGSRMLKRHYQDYVEEEEAEAYFKSGPL